MTFYLEFSNTGFVSEVKDSLMLYCIGRVYCCTELILNSAHTCHLKKKETMQNNI